LFNDKASDLPEQSKPLRRIVQDMPQESIENINVEKSKRDLSEKLKKVNQLVNEKHNELEDNLKMKFKNIVENLEKIGDKTGTKNIDILEKIYSGGDKQSIEIETDKLKGALEKIEKHVLDMLSVENSKSVHSTKDKQSLSKKVLNEIFLQDEKNTEKLENDLDLGKKEIIRNKHSLGEIETQSNQFQRESFALEEQNLRNTSNADISGNKNDLETIKNPKWSLNNEKDIIDTEKLTGTRLEREMFDNSDDEIEIIGRDEQVKNKTEKQMESTVSESKKVVTEKDESELEYNAVELTQESKTKLENTKTDIQNPNIDSINKNEKTDSISQGIDTVALENIRNTKALARDKSRQTEHKVEALKISNEKETSSQVQRNKLEDQPDYFDENKNTEKVDDIVGSLVKEDEKTDYEKKVSLMDTERVKVDSEVKKTDILKEPISDKTTLESDEEKKIFELNENETLENEIKMKDQKSNLEKANNESTKTNSEFKFIKYGFKNIAETNNNERATLDMDQGIQIEKSSLRNEVELSSTEANVPKRDYMNIFEQIKTSIKMDYNSLRKEMKIKLSPEELGEVEVKLSLDNQIMKAEFLVQNQQVKEILESRFNELKNTLIEKGIENPQINVNISNGESNKQKEFYEEMAEEKKINFGKKSKLNLDKNEIKMVDKKSVYKANNNKLNILY